MGKHAASVDARERRRAPAASRWRPPWLTPTRALVLSVAAALAVAGLLIGVSIAGSGSSATPPAADGAATDALFAGIPQSGNVLGKLDAPATLVEFTEPQCPYCGSWARETLPTVVRDYVRTGKLKIVVHGVAFLSPVEDSERALRALAAAGAQDRFFELLHLLYRNQAAEGSGWVTDRLLQSFGTAIPGLDLDRMMAARSSASTTAALDADAHAAKQVMGDRVRAPAFFVQRRGDRLTAMPISTADQLGPGGFSRLLDQMTGS